MLVLAFVMLAMQWAGQRKNWVWLTGTPENADSLPELTPLDFQVKPQLTDADNPAAGPTISLEPNHSADLSQRLPDEWLASMQDGSLGLSASEQQGLDLAIQHVRTQATAIGPAPEQVSFLGLNAHPEQFRGRWLELRGTLWKLSQLNESPPAPPGEEVYDAWLYTPDAGNHPTRVLFTELPATLKPGERLDQPVQFSGYFIKRYGYETAAGTHLAPLFVAKTLVPLFGAIVPTEVRVAKTWPRRLKELFVVIAASAFLIWRLTRTKPPSIDLDQSRNPSHVDKGTGLGVAGPSDFDHNPPA